MKGYDPYNSAKPTTQKDEIIEFIHFHGSITRAQAANLHIYELASRIGELQDDGWRFDRHSVTGRNVHGRAWRCTRYSNARQHG